MLCSSLNPKEIFYFLKKRFQKKLWKTQKEKYNKKQKEKFGGKSIFCFLYLKETKDSSVKMNLWYKNVKNVQKKSRKCFLMKKNFFMNFFFMRKHSFVDCKKI
jgi:hypothetical protein